jgi:hypothetical protein
MTSLRSRCTTWLPAAAIALITFLLVTPSSQADETFTASVTIEQAPSVDCTANLSFGRVLVPGSNGVLTITMNSAGVVSASGTGSGQVVFYGTPARASCSITELADATTYNVAVAQGGTPLSRTGAQYTGGTLALSGSPSLALTLETSAASGQVSADGTINFFGSIVIPADFDQFGLYEGTFTVTVVEAS